MEIVTELSEIWEIITRNNGLNGNSDLERQNINTIALSFSLRGYIEGSSGATSGIYARYGVAAEI